MTVAAGQAYDHERLVRGGRVRSPGSRATPAPISTHEAAVPNISGINLAVNFQKKYNITIKI